MAGVIYQITCISSKLKYIGQATLLKYKRGIPYNYGASGRWNDHVATSKTRNTPLCQAIQTYGRDDFIIEVLEEAPLDTLDDKEAYWIYKLNTVYPNGYNVAKHSRNRHRDTSTLHIFYKGNVKSAILSPIRKRGELKLIYVYLTLNNGLHERLTFGQKKDSIYEDILQDAIDFVNKLNCTHSISTNYSDNFNERYASKINEFNNKIITSVHITSASHLIAIYIGTSDMKLKKEHIRICFGGKNITREDAYNTAIKFVARLNISDKIITDSIKSSQQATA